MTGSHCFLQQVVMLLSKPPWKLWVCLKQGVIILPATSWCWRNPGSLWASSWVAEMKVSRALASHFSCFSLLYKVSAFELHLDKVGMHLCCFFTRNWEASPLFPKEREESNSRAGEQSPFPVFCRGRWCAWALEKESWRRESVEKHLAYCCPQVMGLAAEIEEMQVNLLYKDFQAAYSRSPRCFFSWWQHYHSHSS